LNIKNISEYEKVMREYFVLNVPSFDEFEWSCKRIIKDKENHIMELKKKIKNYKIIGA
jgi:hypothetical protein